MYYTNSRGAIVGLGAAMVCLLVLKFTSRRHRSSPVVLVGVIAVAAPSRGSEMTLRRIICPEPNPFLGRRVGDAEIASVHRRWVRPIHGISLRRLRTTRSSTPLPSSACSGRFVFVGMFYWYFKGSRLIPDTNKEFLPWRRALMVSAVGMLTCGWFLSRQYVPIFYVLLAMGACAVSLNVPPAERSKLQTSRKDVVVICRFDDLRSRCSCTFHSHDGGVGWLTTLDSRLQKISWARPSGRPRPP